MSIKINKAHIFWIVYSVCMINTSCRKQLDVKPLKRDLVPTTLNDLQALLDNQQANNNSPGLLELVADNYYVNSADWQTYASFLGDECQHYIWQSDAVPHNSSWAGPYQRPVFTANLVLDQLPLINLNSGEVERYNNIKGTCLFFRAYAFHQLAQLYCNPYSSSAESDPGIVLRLNSNIIEQSVRATVKQTYDQVINDLTEAINLLPAVSSYPTRPNKTAAYAALSRVYLSMRNYSKAGEYAGFALQQYNELIDYNILLPVQSPPVKTFNKEVIFHSNPPHPTLLSSSIAKIDSMLYQSYDDNDLRKSVFFFFNTGGNAGTYGFRGSYHGDRGSFYMFDGLTTGELYLTRAECLARANDKVAALADLNTLMVKRWRNDGSWTPFDAASAEEAKNIILKERRKELVFRGQRWSDIRRLNLEGANISLQRILNGVNYILPPNDKRSVMLIPWEAVNRSGIAQNPR